jgi:hypothetical protein
MAQKKHENGANLFDVAIRLLDIAEPFLKDLSRDKKKKVGLAVLLAVLYMFFMPTAFSELNSLTFPHHDIVTDLVVVVTLGCLVYLIVLITFKK